MNNTKLFETLSPTKLFFKCASLGMVSMLVSSVYNIADGIFVGNFIGSTALAAINLVMPLVMIAFAVANMIAVGSSVQIAIRLGEKDTVEASKIFTFCTLLILIISRVVGVLAFFSIDQLLLLMGADMVVTKLATEYLTVFALFAPFIMIFFAIDNYLRICGKQKYSMMVNVFTALFNIFLDWLFIVQFQWGLASAAFATCISLTLGTVFCFFPFLLHQLPLKFLKGRITLSTLRNIIVNGSSEFFSNIAGSVLMLMINTVLLNLSGAMGVAAFSVVMYVDSIVASILYGMSDSMQPAISYNFGAGHMKRVFSLEKRVLLFGGVISISFMILMWLKGDFFISLFVETGNQALLDMSIRAMMLYVTSYLFTWFNMIVGSFFTALNQPKASLVIAFLQSFVFPAMGVLILPSLLGLDGIWLSALFANMLTALVTGAYLYKTIKNASPGDIR